jgi:hypothetical protein
MRVAVRLYPDIIVAARVKDSLEDIVLICKDNGRMGSNHFFKEVFEVYVSVGDCLRHQRLYLKRGLGNAFLGFDGKDWTADDYRFYFEENSKIFRSIGTDKYAVNLGNSFSSLDTLENEEVYSRIANFCFGLLLQETYDPMVLEKFGIMYSAT